MPNSRLAGCNDAIVRVFGDKPQDVEHMLAGDGWDLAAFC